VLTESSDDHTALGEADEEEFLIESTLQEGMRSPAFRRL